MAQAAEARDEPAIEALGWWWDRVIDERDELRLFRRDLTTLIDAGGSRMSTQDMGSDAHGRGFVLGSDEGDAYHWLGSLTITKVVGSSTTGRLDVVDHRVPAGYAPPLHVHRGQDEIFFILDGHFTVRCGDQTWQAGPGSLAFLPRDVPHGFTVSEEGPGRTLLVNAPSGFADLIQELGTRADELALPGPDVPMPDPAHAKALSEAHGIFGA